jgi:hypothetical protein
VSWFGGAVGRGVDQISPAPLRDALDRLWAGDDYLRLAAAQADLTHRRDRGKERLARLASSASNAADWAVALAARATLGACDDPALSPEIDLW